MKRPLPAAVLALCCLLLTSCGGRGDTVDGQVPLIGILRVVPASAFDTFTEELQVQGWTAGRTVRIVPTDPSVVFSEAEARAALRRWEASGLSVVIAFSTPYAHLAADETDAPGLFVVNDPVATGLVSDRQRPDGRLTGVTWEAPADRTLDLAARALGGMERIGYLGADDDPAVPSHRQRVHDAADRLGIEVVDASFSGADDVVAAVDVLSAAGVDAVYVASANAVASVLRPIEEALTAARLPALANAAFIDFATITLAPDPDELHRQLARQAARLLSGVQVSAVPTEAPRRFVITIDRTRAQELGLEVASSALREADTVR